MIIYYRQYLGIGLCSAAAGMYTQGYMLLGAVFFIIGVAIYISPFVYIKKRDPSFKDPAS